ncbi:uncharacterized protein RCC_08766 [Ramularia collo-cygni]|uniref:Uncharacterized protein n=1 Tax=Ramularia collo-cygni TaxID=112498 RepID=A0A2D3V0Z2_9PEZI|nr:uncharacterized protein RCC_08766 [Ramularia collo-cygni]CZT23056.1 uncharacterized protein RCC_08766 [Ramularia collo-cygni]
MAESHSKLQNTRGGLRIKLTEDATQDLLVDRETIMKHCPTLAPTLRHSGEDRYCAIWDKSELVTTDNGEEIRVSTLALNPVEETYLLEAKALSKATQIPCSIPFSCSDLAAPEWRVLTMQECQLEPARISSAEQHMILIKLLLGEPLEPLRGFCGYAPTSYLGRSHYVTKRFDFVKLCDLCSLADYYGCLSLVAQEVIRSLGDIGVFYSYVQLRPLLFCGLP